MRKEYEEELEAIRIKMEDCIFEMDGNEWCCHLPDFENLMESPAGFGGTQEDAFNSFINDKSSRPEFNSPFLLKVGSFIGMECRMTNLDFIGYNHGMQSMLVRMQNGNRYIYRDVPLRLWAEFFVSDSKGKFFAEKIKGYYGYYQSRSEE